MSECTPSLTPSLTQSLTRTLPLFFFVLGVLKTGGNEACKGCSCVSENIHTHMRRPLSFPQSSHESTVLCESRHHDSNKSQHSNTNMQANKQTISTLTEAKDKHHAVQERESARDVCARARVCVCVCVCVCTASYFFDFFGTQFMYPLQLYAPQRHTTLFSSSSGN